MIPHIERGSIDGVTALRSDAAHGRYAAALVFRVGRFDETLPLTGITHLVEHLTLRRHHQARYHYNAQVDGGFTAFVMDSADPGDVTGYITAVCQGLAADHREALEQEKRILRTEAASRGGAGILGTCLAERYGARGPGLLAYEELGLHRADWAQVEAWRSRWFTAANAVLWINGPIPRGLRIDLPPGRIPGPETARTARTAPFPGPRGYVITGVGGGIGMSLVGGHGTPMFVTLDILERRLTQVLRHELGVSYGVKSASEWVDAGHLHAWIQADALDEQTSMAAHTMLGAFETLAAEGGTPAEIQDYCRRLREAYESPSGPALALHRQAKRILTGRPQAQPAQLLAAAHEVAGGAIREAARELIGHVIVAVPRYVPAIQGRMPQLPCWSADTVTGQEIEALQDALPNLPGPSAAATLTVGYEGVMLTLSEDQRITVRYPDIAALLCWNDGKRGLIGGDGFTIRLDPAQWPDGPALIAALEARVPPGLRVAIDSPGPPPLRRSVRHVPDAQSAPEPDPKQKQAAPSAARRIPFRTLRALRLLRVLWVVCAIIGIRAVFATDYALGGGFLAVSLAGTLFQEWKLRRLDGT